MSMKGSLGKLSDYGQRPHVQYYCTGPHIVHCLPFDSVFNASSILVYCTVFVRAPQMQPSKTSKSPNG